MTVLFDQQGEDSAEFSKALGGVATLMLQHKAYRHFPMACLAVWIQPAVFLKQIRIFYNQKGHPVGYMTWAYLAPDVEERWINDPRAMLHISEWNEGDNLWIMDFVAPSGFARPIVDLARAEMFQEFQSAKSLRRNADGSVRRVTLWRR